jgi:hypothetical protein
MARYRYPLLQNLRGSCYLPSRAASFSVPNHSRSRDSISRKLWACKASHIDMNLANVVSHGMGKKVIQFPRRKRAPGFPPVAQRRSRTIVVHVGAQRYTIDIACAATALAPGTDPNASLKLHPPDVLHVETKFLRLRQPCQT